MLKICKLNLIKFVNLANINRFNQKPIKWTYLKYDFFSLFIKIHISSSNFCKNFCFSFVSAFELINRF